ncbi:MAG: hypothetical protein RIS18_384 [Actinomycetota bacterium]|jgi:hypothetical protein
MRKKLLIVLTSLSISFSTLGPANAFVPKAKCKADGTKCSKKANTQALRNFAIVDNQHYLNEHNYRVLGKITAPEMASKEFAAASKILKYSQSSYGVCSELLLQMSNLYAARAATYDPADQVDVRANLNGQVVALEDQVHANCNQIKMRW